MTIFRLTLLLLVSGFVADVCTGKDTCMTRWLSLSGIGRGAVNEYEQNLQFLRSDEKTYSKPSPFIYRLLFTKSAKHAPSFLKCISKITSKCKRNPPCANGGVCLLNPAKALYYCRCKRGFVGKFCKTELDGCRSDPCQHGGSCKNHLGDFKCHCLTGYEGTRCEKHWLHPKVYKPIPGKVSRLSVALNKSLEAIEKKFEQDVLGKLRPLSGKLQQVSKTVKQNGQSINKIGNTYIRWGHNRCPRTAQRIYTGFMAGSYYTHKGEGANHLCLPFNPIYVSGVGGAGGAYIYGAEYEAVNSLNARKQNIQNKNIPCAVCRVHTRSTAIMMPARNVCPRGWVREYHGYLMAAHHTHRAGNYICMDREMKTLAGHSGDNNGDLVYPVGAGCNHGIDCAPYQSGKPMTCAFCTM